MNTSGVSTLSTVSKIIGFDNKTVWVVHQGFPVATSLARFRLRTSATRRPRRATGRRPRDRFSRVDADSPETETATTERAVRRRVGSTREESRAVTVGRRTGGTYRRDPRADGAARTTRRRSRRRSMENSHVLQREGWEEEEACPGWHAAYKGARPPQPRDAGPGEWPHGWQMLAVSRDADLQPSLSRPRAAAGSAAILSGFATLARRGTLVHGCQQCRANQHSPSPRRPCSSRCSAACVYPCRLAQTVAAPAPVVGSRSTSTGTMPSLAPARGCWLAERKSSSGLGCAWPARRSDQMGKSSLNNGSCAQPHRECQLTTADGSTSRLDLVVYGATPRGGALCCDATLISPLARTGHPQPGAAETDGAERRKRSTYPELCSGLGGRRALEWRGWPLHAAPTPRPVAKSSAARPPRAGRAVGGAYWLLP